MLTDAFVPVFSSLAVSLLLALGWWLGARKTAKNPGSRASLLAVGLAFVVGYHQLTPNWYKSSPPIDSSDWLPWFIGLWLLLALIQSALPRRFWLAQIFWSLLLGAGYCWLLLSPLHAGGQPVLWPLLGFGFLLSACLLPRTVAHPQTAWLYSALILLLASCSSLLFMYGSSAKIALQAGILAAAQLGALLLSWRTQGSYVFGLNVFILAALWWNACLFSSTPWWQLISLFSLASPLLLRLSLFSKLSDKAQLAWILGLNLLLLTAFTGILWKLQPQDLYLGY